jgi:ketosteroid isomerase-like protein
MRLLPGRFKSGNAGKIALSFMRKTKLQAANLEGDADDVEAAFYEALQTADIEKLMTCWADEDEIVCIHPGGPRVVGAVAIRATFEAMFANGSIRAWPERARKTQAVASAVHNVLERIEVPGPTGPSQAWVIATNVYHRTAQGWRMVAHHASPGTQSDIQEVSDGPQVLH